MTAETITYARALYEVLIDTALEQLRAAARQLEGLPPTAPDLHERLAAALPQSMLTPVRNTILMLANDGALDELDQLIRTFESYRAASTRQIVIVEITSAEELTSEQQARIRRELESKFTEQLDLRFHVDASLIGGLVIRVGDRVFDNSLRTRLSAVQRSMLAG